MFFYLWKLFFFRSFGFDEFSPSLGVIFDVAIKIPELIHTCQGLDGTPTRVGNKVD
jgi:hypothetical protein